MLHLLPLRWILQALIAVVAVIVLYAFYLGWIGKPDSMQGAAQLFRWASTAALALIVLLHVFWRWIPPVQRQLFPYLGGHWTGTINFDNNGQPHSRQVTLQVRQTLFNFKLQLESAESLSSTLVVHAERNPDFQGYRLYYVYLNERKEGVGGAGARYRGLAVMRVNWSSSPELLGDYFTETNRRGTLRLILDESTAWWKLWC